MGDVQLEIALCLTLRGTVREIATFMEGLSSSELVVRFARTDGNGEKHEGTTNLAQQLCSNKEEQKQ